MIRFRSAKSQNRRSRGRPTRSRCSLAVRRGCECSPTGMSFTPILCFSPICATCSTASSPGCLMPNCRRPMRLRARDNFRMPPLDRIRFERDGAMDAVWKRLLAMAEQVAMPDKARIALARLRVVDPVVETTLIGAVLANEIPPEALAEHVFVAAALQVHFARLAARLDAEALVPVGQGACPACGAPPVSTMVVGWSGAHATRFCACSLCGTLWNYPRIKCTLCGSTKDIAYQEIAGGPATSQSRNLRILPFLRQDNAATRECFARSSRGRRRDACP